MTASACYDNFDFASFSLIIVVLSTGQDLTEGVDLVVGMVKRRS